MNFDKNKISTSSKKKSRVIINSINCLTKKSNLNKKNSKTIKKKNKENDSKPEFLRDLKLNSLKNDNLIIPNSKNKSNLNNKKSKTMKKKENKEKNIKKPDFIRDFKLNYLNYDTPNSKIQTLIQYNNLNKYNFSGTNNLNKAGKKKLNKKEKNPYFSFSFFFKENHNINFNDLINVKYFNNLYKECLEVKKISRIKPKFKLKSLNINNIKEDETLFLLNLEETLIYTENYIPGKFYDFTLNISNNAVSSCQNKLGINIRPYLKEFLENLNNKGKIAIFTSNSLEYSKKILKFIIPKNIVIENIICKDYCGIVKNELIKDLRIIKNVKWEKIISFDNCIKHFSFQFYNGFPIFPFKKQKNDMELLNIIDILDEIVNTKNIQLLMKNKIDLFNLIIKENHNDLVETIKGNLEEKKT